MAKLEVFDVSDNRFSGRITRHRASVAGEGSRRSPELWAPLPT